MGAVQHVFRRGDVYWWRRRIGPSHVPGDRVRQPIAVSPRTRERATARLIAAHLMLASEQRKSDRPQAMLTAQQARSILNSVVTD